MCTPLTLCWNPPSGPSGTAGCTARSARFASLVFKNWKISRVDSLFICKHRKHTTEKFCTSILWICFDLLYICALFFKFCSSCRTIAANVTLFSVFQLRFEFTIIAAAQELSSRYRFVAVCRVEDRRRPLPNWGSRRPEGLDEALKSLYLQHHHPATVLANGTINDFLFEIVMLFLIL